MGKLGWKVVVLHLFLVGCAPGDDAPSDANVETGERDGSADGSLADGAPRDGAPRDGAPRDSAPETTPDAGTPDLRRPCHTDCFGGFRCVDGVVYEIVHEPQPCDIPMCPSWEVGVCSEGCAVRHYDGRGVWTTLCEEGRPRVVGDSCATDEDCRPATYAGPPLRRVFLGCDIPSSLCVEIDPPEWTEAACDPEVLVGVSGFGAVEDHSCAGGWCRFYVNAECVHSACTTTCEDSWQCPTGMWCGAPDNLWVDTDIPETGPGLVCRARIAWDGLRCP